MGDSPRSIAGTVSRIRQFKRVARVTLWGILLAAFICIGLSRTVNAVQLGLRVVSTGRWVTSDEMLKSSGAAYSSQALIDALADLPGGDLIVYVANSSDIGSTLGFFHTCYFAAPRRSVILKCDTPDHTGRFFTPIPSGSVKIAAVVFYSMEPPALFSGGQRVGPQLVVVPFSKPLSEVSDWTSFCH